MKLIHKNGVTSVMLRMKILDSASTVGAGKTGLTSASAGLIISTIANNEATATVYAQASSNIETITTLGTYAAPTASKCRFKEVDATNHPGLYEIQIADARFAVSNARNLIVTVSGASGMVAVDAEIQLVSYDPYDTVRLGLTAMPNAAAGANGGLPTGNASGQVVVSSTAVGAIVAASFAAGAIDNAAIATDAIGSAELAASAVTEIQSGLSTLSAADVRTAIGLASANLDTQLAAIAGYIDTEVAAILAAVDTEVGAIKTVTDALAAAMTPPTGVPASNATMLQAMAWLFMLSRNKITQTSTSQVVKADDGTTTVATSTVSDDGTTFTRGKFA